MLATIKKANRFPNTELSDDLFSLQKLYVKLFFCLKTQCLFSKNPIDVLSSYNLKSSKLIFLPDVQSESFQVESYGRRFMVAKEILGRFPRFFKKVLGINGEHSPPVNQIVENDLFQQFLSSEHFFLPEFSISHPYGIGKGYENASKFYFWAIDNIQNRPDLDQCLKIDFGVYLVQQSKHSSLPFYNHLKKGLFFTIKDDKKINDEIYIFITPGGKVLKLGAIDPNELIQKGVISLASVQSNNNGTETEIENFNKEKD